MEEIPDIHSSIDGNLEQIHSPGAKVILKNIYSSLSLVPAQICHCQIQHWCQCFAIIGLDMPIIHFLEIHKEVTMLPGATDYFTKILYVCRIAYQKTTPALSGLVLF